MESIRVISTELFPYDKFGFRLEFGEKKNITVCWFECQEHLDKYLERYKLDKRTIKLDYRDEKSPVRSKKHKGDLEQKSQPKSNRSPGSVRKRKPSMDSTGNTSRTTKRKK
jgi:hypothetical protein